MVYILPSVNKKRKMAKKKAEKWKKKNLGMHCRREVKYGLETVGGSQGGYGLVLHREYQMKKPWFKKSEMHGDLPFIWVLW